MRDPAVNNTPEISGKFKGGTIGIEMPQNHKK
jgi:hypothetical protein